MNSELIRNYQEAKNALEKYYDHVTEVLIVRSKANWIEYGEKSNKYFPYTGKTAKRKFYYPKAFERKVISLKMNKKFYKV